RHAGDGGDHGDGGLASAGDHVDVGRVEVGVEVDDRHHVGTDSGGGEIDDAYTVLLQDVVVTGVSAGAGGVEHDADVLEFGQFDQAVYAFMGGGDVHAPGAGEAIGFRVDADHGGHFEVAAMAQDFDHQIGADVAGAD